MRTRRALLAVLVALAVGGCGSTADVGARATGEAPGDSRPACDRPATARSAPAVEPLSAEPVPHLPVSYVDITGKPVKITDTSRILALDTFGTLATTVYTLGLGDRLVGRDVSTGVPALQHLPLVTHNGHELNAEAIFDLNPSVVLTDYSIGPLEVQLQLRDAGIPVVIMSDQRSRALIGPQVEAVATALGVPAAGRGLAARVESETAVAEAQVSKLAPRDEGARLRIVFLYVRGTAGVYYWFGKGSGADDLIDALEGVDVATESGLQGSRPLTAEGLVRANPDLFLMMSEGLRSVGGVKGLQKVPGVAETTAGINSCVVDMSDYQILSFGPQFPATLDALAEAVYRGTS